MDMLGNVERIEMQNSPHYYWETLIKYLYRHAGEYDLQDVGNVVRYVQGCTVVEQCRTPIRI